jgi:rubrerythrin
MKGLLYILVFVFALDAQAGILFRRRSGGGIFSGPRRSGGIFRRRVGCIPGQCAQSGFYRNQGARPFTPNRGGGGCSGGGCGSSNRQGGGQPLPQSFESGEDIGGNQGGHESFEPGVSERPVAESGPAAADPVPAFDPTPASSTVAPNANEEVVPAPAILSSGTRPNLAAGTPAPKREEKNSPTEALKKYFEKQKGETNQKAEEWKKKILDALGKDSASLRTAIEELLIEDQMFLEPDEEEAAFGKRLNDFLPEERKSLVLQYTAKQKELREKLLTEVAESIKKEQNPKAKSVGESLAEIKKDHLEAYDKVMEEIEKGTIETSTTYCFTCGAGEEIGNEGYTFGGAMEEAAARVVARLNESTAQSQSSPAKPQENKPKEAPRAQAPTPAVTKRPSAEQAPKPQVSPTEKSARERIANPVLQGSRAAGNGRIAFEKYMGILQSDPSLSDSTLRRFLNSGPYANNSASYRSKIDGMTREQLLGAVAKFLDGTGPYTHCPSCNLGAGGRLSR